MDNFLKDSDTFDNCIVCGEQSKKRSLCCNQTICGDCYFEWLKYKRECMHCKKDQTTFEDWVENYRDESVRNNGNNLEENLLNLTFSINTVNANNINIEDTIQSITDIITFFSELENYSDLDSDSEEEYSMNTMNTSNVEIIGNILSLNYQEFETLDLNTFREMLRAMYGIDEP